MRPMTHGEMYQWWLRAKAPAYRSGYMWPILRAPDYNVYEGTTLQFCENYTGTDADEWINNLEDEV